MKGTSAIRHQERNRYGFTLIELVVVISMLGFISVIGVQAISLLFEADARSTKSVIAQLTRERLASQFRADIHNAISVNAAKGDATMPFEIEKADNIRVTYDIEKSRLIRRVKGEGRHESHDSYQLRDVSCRFETAANVATLTLESTTDSLSPEHRMDIMEDAAPGQFKIHAVTGHQLRHLRADSNSAEVNDAE